MTNLQLQTPESECSFKTIRDSDSVTAYCCYQVAQLAVSIIT